MPNVGKMISDVALRLNPKPSDDFVIDKDQIRFWLDSIAPTLNADWINKKNGGEVPPQLIKPYDCLVVKSEEVACISGCNTRYYIELPKNSDGTVKSILSLPEDKGIVQLLQGNKPILRVSSMAKLQMALKLEFAGGFSYYNRVNDKIYLFNGIFPSYCKLTAFIASCDSTDLDDEDSYPTVDDVVPMILEEAEKIGTKELSKKIDLQDDGIGN